MDHKSLNYLLIGAIIIGCVLYFTSPQKGKHRPKPGDKHHIHVIDDEDDAEDEEAQVELSKTGKVAKTTATNLLKGYAKAFADVRSKIEDGTITDGDSFGKESQKLTTDMLIKTFAQLDKLAKSVGTNYDEDAAKEFSNDVSAGFKAALLSSSTDKKRRPHFFSLGAERVKPKCPNCNCGVFPGCSCSELCECLLENVQ